MRHAMNLMTRGNQTRHQLSSDRSRRTRDKHSHHWLLLIEGIIYTPDKTAATAVTPAPDVRSVEIPKPAAAPEQTRASRSAARGLAPPIEGHEDGPRRWQALPVIDPTHGGPGIVYAGLDVSRKRVNSDVPRARGERAEMGATPGDADGLCALDRLLPHDPAML